ncbi:MAG TPA: alanine racemase [Alphaproteobacteria bacterium]|nr:alanine racemase [Alphaproteobacteria bacterium]
MHTHSSWIEVSLANLRHNFRMIFEHVQPGAALCPIIKCDAYGHGADRCALALQQEGAQWFGVTSVEEGAALRQAGVTTRILVLSSFWSGEEDRVVEYDLTPAVWSRKHVELLAGAVEKLKAKPVRVHLKVNTGMNRLGADIKDVPDLCQLIRSESNIFLEGVFSHLASSEVTDSPTNQTQIQRFKETLTKMKELGFDPLLRHMGNSSAIAAHPDSWFNLVRPGLAVYGYFLPFSSVVTGSSDWSRALPVKPVLTWKARVVQVRDVEARQPVGYSSAYATQRPTRVAIVSAGYGDGLNRNLSSRGRMIVRDNYAPVIGNVSMNLTATDVTEIPGVEVGDEVIIIGQTPRCKVTAWDHATLASTIPYDILCNISSRLPREYPE